LHDSLRSRNGAENLSAGENREVVSVYSGYTLGVEVIQRTVAVDFPGLRVIGGERNEFSKD
jgi:hypothetical protein